MRLGEAAMGGWDTEQRRGPVAGRHKEKASESEGKGREEAE
jgi:hypothetical protein